jgi:SPP1 family predicted phage head-tail adaptor
MRSGELDRSIVIQARTETGRDAMNAPIFTWAKIHIADTIPAAIETAGGSERFFGQQLIAKTDKVFRIRYRSDVGPLNRIVYDGRDWDINATHELGRRDGLLIAATARAE